MRKVPYYNPTDKTQHLGPVSVRPHSTREVDPRDIPGYKPGAAERPAPADPTLELLDNSIKDIAERLPDLSDEELDSLEEAEINGKTRKGLLEAITEERLNREQQGGSGENSSQED